MLHQNPKTHASFKSPLLCGICRDLFNLLLKISFICRTNTSEAENILLSTEQRLLLCNQSGSKRILFSIRGCVRNEKLFLVIEMSEVKYFGVWFPYEMGKEVRFICFASMHQCSTYYSCKDIDLDMYLEQTNTTVTFTRDTFWYW